MAKHGGDDIESVILSGITFKSGGKKQKTTEESKVKTKAKKKKYITGAHGSGSANKKVDIRRKRSTRKRQ